jgi:SAM-dependent methyltransferase
VHLEDLNYLLSPEGQQLLSELAQERFEGDDHLRLASRLRRQVGQARAHALLETSLLRRRATTKFQRAQDMYFTRQALEQASAEIVAGYRAGRFVQAGFEKVADLGCGIGGDSMALAANGPVIGVDLDLLRLAMARENVRLYGFSGRFLPLQANLLALDPLPVEAIFADPGRRTKSGRRIYSVHDYRPPLNFLERWRKVVPHQAVKISPGVNYEELPTGAEVEFISVNGGVREAVLWFGALRSTAGRRATLLPQGVTMTDERLDEEVITTGPKDYLYEPDGAVIRAHLVEQLAQHIGATKIDDDIAYLTSDDFRTTPFGRCYAIEDSFPFGLKRLRKYLRERGIGQVTIKKRGSPLDPDTLRQQLRLKGEGSCVVFLTRVMGEPSVLIGRAHPGA